VTAEIGRRTDASISWRVRRQYLHVFGSAACVLPFVSYVLSDVGWRPAAIGIGTALLGITGAAAGPVWGAFDDRTGRAFGAALLASAVSAALIFAAVTARDVGRPWLVWLALALFGATAGPLEALLTTSVMFSNPDGRVGSFRLYGSLGWVVGVGLGASALSMITGNPGATFVVAALVAVTGPRARRAVSERAGQQAPFRPPVRAVLAVLAVTWPVAFALEPMVQLSAGWAHADLRAGPFAASAPLAIAAALELPAFPLADRLADRYSARTVALLGLPPLAVSWLVLALWPGRIALFAVQPLVALTFALWFVGQAKLLAAGVSSARLAAAQTLGSLLSLGVIGPAATVVGGLVAQQAGYRSMFVVMALIAALGCAAGRLGSSQTG
jgi:MFS family permease